MVVKDTISPEIYLPRFLSVGDRAMGELQVTFGTDAARGRYEILLEIRSGATVLSHKRFIYDLEGGDTVRFETPVVLQTENPGDLDLTVHIQKEGSIAAKRSWKLAVRSRYPEVSIRKTGILEKESYFDPQTHFDPALWAAPHRVTLTLSGQPLIATDSIANELIDYWGRCAEQTTSRAMPWLFLDANSSLAKRINTQAIVTSAIERLLTYQKLDGGFGLWEGSKAEMWLSAYVMDFLLRAKKAGYAVPDRTVRAGLAWIENHLDRWSSEGSRQEADAYGLYVLTRAGRTLMAELLHRAKDTHSAIRSAQAWAHLGAALAWVGEKSLAESMFERASGAVWQESGYFANYGGVLRDEAALVVLMQESGLGLDWESRYATLAQSVKKRRWLSTQEMSLLLRAVFSARFKPTPLLLTADGKALPIKDGVFTATAETLQQLPVIRNQSGSACWYSLDFRATPNEAYWGALPSNGMAVTKRYYTIEGKEADLESLEQNDRLVVVIEGEIQSAAVRYPLVTDWIPAGFELENPDLDGIDPLSTFAWLGKRSQTDYTAYRNDRFIAALQKEGERHFRVAYIVRAVTPGSYTLPPVIAEAMYQPWLRAVSPLYAGRVRILGSGVTATTQAPVQAGKKGTSAVRKLTEADFDAAYSTPLSKLDDYTITQINLLRNAIFARAGLDFKMSNPMLYRLFSKHSWYHPRTTDSAAVYRDLTRVQKENVQKLFEEERRRGGGLVLGDFYRVRAKALTRKDLEKYSKKQLAILRNSLFARYGITFHTPEYQRIFSAMPWYHPSDISDTEIFENRMSDQERANVRLIREMERHGM
jgi:uncharacterized protein YfaS (alpha-2-macroglobulin family)